MSIDKERILGIAQRYILKGQSKKAIKELQKLVEGSPQDSRLRLKLGDIYLKNGENENAIREFLKVAELYVEEDLSLRAISIYKKVLSINPNYIEALHEMAKLYIKEGLEGSAKNCYQTILKMRPDDPETLSALEGINHRQQPKEDSEAGPSRLSAILRQTPHLSRRFHKENWSPLLKVPGNCRSLPEELTKTLPSIKMQKCTTTSLLPTKRWNYLIMP